MPTRRIAAVLIAAALISFAFAPAAAAPTAIAVSFPVTFGHREHESAPAPDAAAVRAERRARLARYGLQLADAIVSLIGYHAYARCLSCLAFPGGGPRGSAPAYVADFNANRPAEIDPIVAPLGRGGVVSLILGTVAYDVADARIERRWTLQRRFAADVAEIGGHLWGISTWLPEIKNIRRATTIASACGAEWSTRQYGRAFTDGCVNEYYRAAPGSAALPPLVSAGIDFVCAPTHFNAGTYLFATQNTYVVADGTPCPAARSPFR